MGTLAMTIITLSACSFLGFVVGLIYGGKKTVGSSQSEVKLDTSGTHQFMPKENMSAGPGKFMSKKETKRIEEAKLGDEIYARAVNVKERQKPDEM